MGDTPGEVPRPPGIELPKIGDVHAAPDLPGKRWMYVRTEGSGEADEVHYFEGWVLTSDPTDPPSKYHAWDEDTQSWLIPEPVQFIPGIITADGAGGSGPGGPAGPAGPAAEPDPGTPTDPSWDEFVGRLKPDPQPGDEAPSEIPGKKYVWVVMDDMDGMDLRPSHRAFWVLMDDRKNPPSKYHRWDDETQTWNLPEQPGPGVVSPRPPMAPSPDPEPGGTPWVPIAIVVAVVLVVGIGALLLLSGGDDESDEAVEVIDVTTSAPVTESTSPATTTTATTVPPSTPLPEDVSQLLSDMGVTDVATESFMAVEPGMPTLDAGGPATEFPAGLGVERVFVGRRSTITAPGGADLTLGSVPDGPVHVFIGETTEPLNLTPSGQVQLGVSTVLPDRPVAPPDPDPNTGTNQAVIADLGSRSLVGIGYDGTWAEQQPVGLFATRGRAWVFVVPAEGDLPTRVWSFSRVPADDPAAGSSQLTPADAFIDSYPDLD